MTGDVLPERALGWYLRSSGSATLSWSTSVPRRGHRRHATLVGRLVIGAEQTFVLRTDGPAEELRTAWQPARLSVRLDPADRRLAFCYPAVGTRRALAARLGTQLTADGVGTGHRREAELVAAAAAPLVQPRRLLELGGGGDLTVADDRLEPLIRTMNQDPTGRTLAVEAADLAGLSRSHLQRVFTAATGTSLRRYRQWLRVLHATRGLARGHDLTRIAVEAGFASPSHFSDTIRMSFGFTASELTGGGLPIQVAEG